MADLKGIDGVYKYLVDEWTVLMAIRYGMGRLTYANTDASSLALQFWDEFKENTRESIYEDVMFMRRIRTYDETIQAWDWLVERYERDHNIFQ